jgi:hypothetical protein
MQIIFNDAVTHAGMHADSSPTTGSSASAYATKLADPDYSIAMQEYRPVQRLSWSPQPVAYRAESSAEDAVPIKAAPRVVREYTARIVSKERHMLRIVE